MILKKLKDLVIKTRKFGDTQLARVGKDTFNKTILELGSGKEYKGYYYYSAKQFFNDTNDFHMSDINEAYGHPIIDVTTMSFENKYDIIICMNVLEHVYDYQKAIDNMYKALKPNGKILFQIPMVYPLHDEPMDYNRFTKYKLFKLFDKQFNIDFFSQYGWHKSIPFAYYMELTKK